MNTTTTPKRPYTKPSLLRRETLATVTAQVLVSGQAPPPA